MAGLAKALQVVSIPKQRLVSSVGFDVIHHSGRIQPSCLAAKGAQRFRF